MSSAKENAGLVSVIITSKNESAVIENLLKSLNNQTYSQLEILLVDNNSTDKTKAIARKYTPLVFNKGPERSAQRNFGAKKARGKFVLFLDADMMLSDTVIKDCVVEMQRKKVGGVIIPEESYGEGFWAHVKKLERSFYVGNDDIEAARFYSRDVFLQLKGFDEMITGPEDWDFSQKVKATYGLTRIKSYIFHNERHLSFTKTVGKKFYYARDFLEYTKKAENKRSAFKQMNIFRRYQLFLSRPQVLFKNPLLGIGVLTIKTAEFTAGGVGYALAKLRKLYYNIVL